MLIALDYDDTFTADRVLWSQFIGTAQARGHRVVIVSARRNTMPSQLEIRRDVDRLLVSDVILTSHNPKREFCERLGLRVDIWIDDKPEAVIQSDDPAKRVPYDEAAP